MFSKSKAAKKWLKPFTCLTLLLTGISTTPSLATATSPQAIVKNGDTPVGIMIYTTLPGADEIRLDLITHTGFYVRLEGSVYSRGMEVKSVISKERFYFEKKDCTGQAFIANPRWPIAMGSLIHFDDNLYYLKQDQASEKVEVMHYMLKGRGECKSMPKETKQLVPVYPNDEQVTGVPKEGFSGPIAIEMR
ncbi:MAG: hypothetical protein HQL52_04910 [Magnetococcales bacterium]|nr:hypothetical protein [Magnetococcales bacterium]